MFAARMASLEHIDFSYIRYAQCWEDADILLEALDIQSTDTCLSIASAGDNTLSLLCKNPKKIYAIDLNPAQLACLDLRIAAFQELDHHQLLGLLGCHDQYNRQQLYQQCRPFLQQATQGFWDQHLDLINQGIGHGGKFERYFALFRRYLLPLIHRRRTIDTLFNSKSPEQRHHFYDRQWDNWRWRLLFKLFFSRRAMGRLGRDPQFFRYVQGSVAERLMQRAEYALTELDPRHNPYLQWIVNGNYDTELPHYLRAENFQLIRERVGRIEIRQCSLDEFLHNDAANEVNKYNLSDIFEYVSGDEYQQLLEKIIERAPTQARLAYWNMLVPRQRPTTMRAYIRPLQDLADTLFARDKAFFYSRFIVEEVNT